MHFLILENQNHFDIDMNLSLSLYLNSISILYKVIELKTIYKFYRE
jgi:hypothetical protein